MVELIEVLVYVHYLDWTLGKPVSEYLAIQEPKSGCGSDILEAISPCVSQTTGMADREWKERLTVIGSDGCAVMTGPKSGVWGRLQQDPLTNYLKEFWCGAHKVDLAVVKSLQHYDDFIKLRNTPELVQRISLQDKSSGRIEKSCRSSGRESVK